MLHEANVTRHVIVVESNVHDYVLISHALRERGTPYALRRVQSATELDEELRRQTPDLVICDHGGSAWDAQTVLKQVRDFAATLPVIVLHTPVAGASGAPFPLTGADGCVGKDCLGQLPTVVDRIWRQRNTALRRPLRNLPRPADLGALEPVWSAGYVG